jgi:23S rRNA (cytidine1920-2'-O)/16S rRNA (cytidine1409-2'-O)-methyltransferase
VKKRLDVLLVERGLAESRAQAQALVIAGLVPGYEKPGAQVDEGVDLTVDATPRYVSRGGEKLENALTAFGVDPSGRDCLDVGASTGGFTDCLLQHGAARVIALDVGYGQLHPRLRGDPRVTVLERVNVRYLAELPFPPGLVTCDVSFISVRTALPAALALAAPGWEALVLVKPQFEAGRAEVRKGVVRDPGVWKAALLRVSEAAIGWGAETVGVVDSGVPGPKGNREFFLHLVQREKAVLPDDIARRIADAVA